MKSFAVCALVALMVIGGRAEEPFKGPLVTKTKEHVIVAQRNSEATVQSLKSKCEAEFTALEAFAKQLGLAGTLVQAEHAQNVDKALSAARAKQSLELETLLAMRARMGKHIARVNKAYGVMHEGAMQDVDTATLLLRELGDVLQTHDSLSTPTLDPIDYKPHPLGEEAEEEAEEHVEAREASDAKTAMDARETAAEAAFLEVADIPPKAASHFIDAYKAAVFLYNGGLAAARRIKFEFEHERSTLTTFKDLLDTLVHARHTKLNMLEEEAEATNAALAKGDPTLDKTAKLIKEHEEVFENACDSMRDEFHFFTEQRAHLLADIEAGIVHASTGLQGVASNQ